MQGSRKNHSRRAVTNEPVYLTKRILVSTARAAGKRAAVKAMKVMGHAIVVHKGWLVKKYPDGHMDQIEQIASPENQEIALD